MNKAELVDVVAKSAGISKVASEKAVDGALDAIKGALKRGQSVTLVGFGTFKVGKRAARLGRNPQTGAEIPDNIKNRLDIHPVKWIDSVFDMALERKTEPLSDEQDIAQLPAVAEAPAPAAVKH